MYSSCDAMAVAELLPKAAMLLILVISASNRFIGTVKMVSSSSH
jgi:hypothetical protein